MTCGYHNRVHLIRDTRARALSSGAIHTEGLWAWRRVPCPAPVVVGVEGLGG